MKRAGGRSGERGFALLIVLWTLVLVALLVTQIAAAGRDETRIAGNLRRAAIAEAAADGALYEAVFRLLDPAARPLLADGAPHPLALPGGTATLIVEDEAGKLDANAAPPEVLAALLRRVGADARLAAAVAAGMASWRSRERAPGQVAVEAAAYRQAGRSYGPPGARFQSYDEIGLVLGMTPELLARLRPALTVYHEGEPDRAAAPPLVRQALADAPGAEDESVILGGSSAPAFTVTAIAALRDGGRFTRRAVIRLGGQPAGRPYQILAWTME